MKLLLIGYYGYGNIGDEALLEAIINALKKEKIIEEFYVLSYNVEATSKEHQVKAISRGKHLDLIRAIREVDAVVVGGGSVLQDVTSSLSLFYYMTILFLAKIFKKKAFLLGNGYGPINKRLNQFLLTRLLPYMDGVIARDRESFLSYQEFKLKHLFAGVDLVYLLNSRKVKKQKSSKKNVVISLRPWYNASNTHSVMRETINYLESLGYKISLLPMKSPEDDKELEYYLSEEINLIAHDFNVILKELADADFVIGMRLHALILAAKLNTPFIAISYDPKVDSFNRQISKRKTIHTEDMTFDELKENVDYLINNLDKERSLLAELNLRNQKLAEKQLQTFINWLEE